MSRPYCPACALSGKLAVWEERSGLTFDRWADLVSILGVPVERHAGPVVAQRGQRAMPAFHAGLFDVRPGRLGHAESVHRQQRDQGAIAGAGQTVGDEHRAELVAVEPDCV